MLMRNEGRKTLKSLKLRLRKKHIYIVNGDPPTWRQNIHYPGLLATWAGNETTRSRRLPWIHPGHPPSLEGEERNKADARTITEESLVDWLAPDACRESGADEAPDLKLESSDLLFHLEFPVRHGSPVRLCLIEDRARWGRHRSSRSPTVAACNLRKNISCVVSLSSSLERKQIRLSAGSILALELPLTLSAADL